MVRGCCTTSATVRLFPLVLSRDSTRFSNRGARDLGTCSSESAVPAGVGPLQTTSFSWLEGENRMLGEGINSIHLGGFCTLAPQPSPCSSGPGSRSGNTHPETLHGSEDHWKSRVSTCTRPEHTHTKWTDQEPRQGIRTERYGKRKPTGGKREGEEEKEEESTRGI